MATMANIQWQTQNDIGKSLISTEVWPLFDTPYGHIWGYCNMTAPETILTAVTNGFISAFARGAQVWSVNTVATSTCMVVENQGTASAPSWVALHSAAN